MIEEVKHELPKMPEAKNEMPMPKVMAYDDKGNFISDDKPIKAKVKKD
jgi:hypothetical protein